MNIINAKGNTYCLDGDQLIPFYKTDDHHCILLDTGTLSVREEIEQTLSKHGLTPVAILGTHSHTDHSPNHGYFQKKYQLPVTMSLGEAGICANSLNLKSYYYMYNEMDMMKDPEFAQMVHVADQIIMPDQTQVTVAGISFGILHTPGHSPDHISIVTPDGVVYLGDALLTEDNITRAKIPYFFSIRAGLSTMEALASLDDYHCFIAAHKGIYTDIKPQIRQAIDAIRQQTELVLECFSSEPITLSEAYIAITNKFMLLSSKLPKAKLYDRNIRVYVEYLKEIGAITSFAKGGVEYYFRMERYSGME